MSDQPSSPPAPPEPQRESKSEPKTQGQMNFRKRLPIWMQEMPRLRFQPSAPDPNYQLIDRDGLEDVLNSLPPNVREDILKDMEFMEYELMRLFRQRDYDAKKQQNRYRRVQISYLLLAALATTIGSIQALAFNSNPETAPVYAFLGTVVALMATFIATISGREPPLPSWLQNRRRAEMLRREYFRFLTRMPPYDEVGEGYQRRILLSKRAADINRGVYPQEVDPRSGSGSRS